jgi:hypothetical protein
VSVPKKAIRNDDSSITHALLREIERAVHFSTHNALRNNDARLHTLFTTEVNTVLAKLEEARHVDKILSCSPAKVKQIIDQNTPREQLENIHFLAKMVPKLVRDLNEGMIDVESVRKGMQELKRDLNEHECARDIKRTTADQKDIKDIHEVLNTCLERLGALETQQAEKKAEKDVEQLAKQYEKKFEDLEKQYAEKHAKLVADNEKRFAGQAELQLTVENLKARFEDNAVKSEKHYREVGQHIGLYLEKKRSRSRGQESDDDDFRRAASEGSEPKKLHQRTAQEAGQVEEALCKSYAAATPLSPVSMSNEQPMDATPSPTQQAPETEQQQQQQPAPQAGPAASTPTVQVRDASLPPTTIPLELRTKALNKIYTFHIATDKAAGTNLSNEELVAKAQFEEETVLKWSTDEAQYKRVFKVRFPGYVRYRKPDFRVKDWVQEIEQWRESVRESDGMSGM